MRARIRVGGLEGVGAAGEADAHAAGGLAVDEALDVEGLAGELDAGDVGEADLRAVGVDAEDDGGELVGGLQAGLGGDRGVELLAGDGRDAAELAGGDLGVLGLDRGADVEGGEAVGGELVGVEPDAHGVLGAEGLDLADAGDAGDRVLQGRDDIVGDVVAGHAAVGRDEGGDHQEVHGRLGDAHALALDLLGQLRHGELQLVLDLDLGDVGVGAGLEGDGDGGGAGGVEVEETKRRPSRPLSFCSMTWVTVSSRVLAEAPG
jgi:hypothetical protein